MLAASNISGFSGEVDARRDSDAHGLRGLVLVSTGLWRSLSVICEREVENKQVRQNPSLRLASFAPTRSAS